MNFIPHNKYEWFWFALTLTAFIAGLVAFGFMGWLYLLSRSGGLP
jgi:hypothetical protein